MTVLTSSDYDNFKAWGYPLIWQTDSDSVWKILQKCVYMFFEMVKYYVKYNGQFIIAEINYINKFHIL